MNVAQMKSVLRAIDTLDRAAQTHSARVAMQLGNFGNAERLYKAAKTRVGGLLKAIVDWDQHIYAPLPDEREATDDELRALWRSNGGDFHGPNVEHGSMKEEDLLPFLRQLVIVKRNQSKE